MAVLLLLTFNLGYFSTPPTVEIDLNEEKTLEAHFLDVGQGDAIYIRTPDEVDVLIDGGPDNNLLSRLGQVMPFYDHRIDIMILTHPHADHVTGLVEVLKRYEVGEIYYTGVLHSTADYLTWLRLIEEKGIPLKIVQSFFELRLDDNIDLQFLYPDHSLINKKVAELNNSSIVNRLVYNNIEIMLTGDAEAEVEEHLLVSGHDLSADIFKAGHHGSSSSSSEEFVRAVDPEAVIIQSGQDNAFGHPHLRSLRLFERLNLNIYRNDLLGTISVYTDGDQYFID